MIKSFDWEAFKNTKIAVNCKTIEEENDFCKQMDSQGIKPARMRYILDYYSVRDNGRYYFMEGSYSNCFSYEDCIDYEYTILKWSDYMEFTIENKYPEDIMKTLRQRLGLKADDTSRDNLINSYSLSDAFDEMLKWEGIIGYTSTIKYFIESIYGIDLDAIGN